MRINGNRNVPELWKNGTKRNLNLNWFDNRWNDNYRFLAVRHGSRFLLGSVPGSFLYSLLAPATQHLADFCKIS